MRRRSITGVVASLLLVVSSLPFSAGAVLAAPQTRAVSLSGSSQTFIVTVRDRSSLQGVLDRGRVLGGGRFTIFRYALGGFSAFLSPNAVVKLRADSRVKRLTRNVGVRSLAMPATEVLDPTVQDGAPYHLDRLDQTQLPLNDEFQAGATGAGVQIYMIDTGVHAAHTEFNGRVVRGIDVVGPDQRGVPAIPSDDCDGHGTHTAGLAGGKTFGVAKQATLVAVRVLDCNGDGDIAGVIKGIDWVLHHHRNGSLAVANLSLGVEADENSVPLDDAVLDLIADGIVPVVAAGNQNTDACDISPGHLPEVLNVAAVDYNDARFKYSDGGSNYGSCVDLFAPGVRLLSSGSGSDTETHYESGTSMASPLVGGYAALLAQQFPSACPNGVMKEIIARATPNVVKDPGPGSANLLLNVTNLEAVGKTIPGTPSALVASPTANGVVVSWDKGCDGDSAPTATTVQVFEKGATAPFSTKRYSSALERLTVRGLSAGKKYQVRVRRESNMGGSGWSLKSVAIAPDAIVAGERVQVVRLANSNEATINGQWVVTEASQVVCRLTPNQLRLYFLKKGKCSVVVTPRYTDVPFTRTIVVGETNPPPASGVGSRLVYSRSEKRLYAISGDNIVARSFAAVAPVAAPPIGKYVLREAATTESVEKESLHIEAYRKNIRVVGVSRIPEVCDSAGLCADAYGVAALGTAVSTEGIYLPAADALWLSGWVKEIKTFVIVK